MRAGGVGVVGYSPLGTVLGVAREDSPLLRRDAIDVDVEVDADEGSLDT